MSESFLTSGEVAEASGCLPTTLRQWRDRNGLLPHLNDPQSPKWARFTLADALAVCVVHRLTTGGIAAQPAVNLANSLKTFFEGTVRGGLERFVGVGYSNHPKAEGPRLEFKVFANMASVADELGYFDSAVIIVLNIHLITWELLSSVEKTRHSTKDTRAQVLRRMMLDAAAKAIRPEAEDDNKS